MTNLTPERVIQVGMGFWPARTLQVATKLGLFTALGKTPMTGAQIADALRLAPRAVPDFPDALVALKFLEREGAGPEAIYSNSVEAAMFLDKGSPAYVGGILEMAHDRLYPFWAISMKGCAPARRRTRAAAAWLRFSRLSIPTPKASNSSLRR